MTVVAAPYEITSGGPLRRLEHATHVTRRALCQAWVGGVRDLVGVGSAPDAGHCGDSKECGTQHGGLVESTAHLPCQPFATR